MCDVFFFGTALRIDSQISETRLGIGMTIEGSRGAGHSRAPRGRKLLEGPAGRREAEATARKDWRKPVEGAARSDIVIGMDCYFAVLKALSHPTTSASQNSPNYNPPC
jgi:hypothetical protein